MRRLVVTSAITLLALTLLAPSARAEWIWPLRGEVITPYRNGSDPYASGQHRGIDIAGDVGATVVAAAGGEVRFAGTAGSSGLTVSVRTSDGRFDTSYLHLASTHVRAGDRVGAGDRIGTVGTSGIRSATAPHLHFGVRDAGSRHAYHDPLGFLPPPAAGPPPPEAAPAPQPAPAPVAPPSAPVDAPARRREPIRAPGGRRVPVAAPNGRPVPVSAPDARRVPLSPPRGRRAPAGSPNARGVPMPAPEGRRLPVAAPNGRRAPLNAPDERSDARSGLDPRHAPALASEPRRSPAHAGGSASRMPNTAPTPPGEPSSRGPDLGLALACLGLLAAAALLGLTEDGQKAARRTRHRVTEMLRPVLGRR